MGLKPRVIAHELDQPEGAYLWTGELHIRMPQFVEKVGALPPDAMPIPKMELLEPRGRPEKYPWSKMKTGDSFVVVGKSRRTIQNCALRARERHGKRFSIHRVTDETRRLIFQVTCIESPGL